MSLLGSKIDATTGEDSYITAFLHRLPNLNLSETGRRNVCNRFNLTDDELRVIIARYQQDKIRQLRMPVPAKEFGADSLECAIALSGSAYPTAIQLDAALLEMYPSGGPTAASLVAAGWLVPTIDNKGLRKPPLIDVSPSSKQNDDNC